MNYYLRLALNLLIIVPAIVGWVRFSKISPAFLPFLLFVWVGALSEIYSAIVVNFFHLYNIVSFNIYSLAEICLLLWYFKRLNLFNAKTLKFLLLTSGIVWLLETIFVSKLSLDFNNYSRIFFDFIIVLLSIAMLNQQLLKARKNLLKDAVFIICIGFILMFTYSLLVASFFLYRLNMSDNFHRNISLIFVFMNFFCNMVYAVAILLMPKRQAFTLQY